MADQLVAEAIERITFLTQDDVRGAFITAFAKPAPPIKASTLGSVIADLKSPEATMQRLLMREPILEKPFTTKQFQRVHTYPDGTQAGFEIDYASPRKFAHPIQENFDVESLWKGTDRFVKASQRADAFINNVNRLDALPDKLEKLDVLIQAAEKCGIPKSQTDRLVKNGNIENAVKAAMTRHAVKSAFINGTWQSAGLTAVFDIQRLFNGQFIQYLTNIGVSGLYGGSVGAFSSWVNHPFFGNGIVLGIFVGSAFGAVSLATTGDWARFGKSLGINILGGAAAWCGMSVGAAIGVPAGPVGIAIGGLIGGMAAGWACRSAAEQIPGLHVKTDQEVITMDKAIKQQIAAGGMELESNLSPRQLVEATMAKGTGGSGGLPFRVRMTDSMAASVTDFREVLLDLHQNSPEAFGEFLELLRVASSDT